MRQKGFSPILVIIITALVLGSGIFLYKNLNLSLPIKQSPAINTVESLPNVSAIEQQIKNIPSDKLNRIECATLGFSGGTDSQGNYKEGGNYIVYGKTQTQLSVGETDRLNKALLTVIPEHPPKYNPDMQMCLSESDNVLLIERGGKSDPNSLFIFQLTKGYEPKKQLTIKMENQLQGRSEMLAYTKEGILYLWIKGEDSVENIYKIDFNSQKVELAARGSAKLVSITLAPDSSSGISSPKPYISITRSVNDPNWKIYKNSKMGLEFEYPSEYRLTNDGSGDNETITLKIPFRGKPGEMRDGEMNITINPDPNLQEFVMGQFHGDIPLCRDDGMTYVSACIKKKILLGQNITEYIGDGFQGMYSFVTTNDKRLQVFTTASSLLFEADLMNKIIPSIKFI